VLDVIRAAAASVDSKLPAAALYRDLQHDEPGGLKMQDLKMRDHRNTTGNWRTSCRKRLHSVISGYLRNGNEF